MNKRAISIAVFTGFIVVSLWQSVTRKIEDNRDAKSHDSVHEGPNEISPISPKAPSKSGTRSKSDPGKFAILNGERRALPISEDEAIQRALTGISRSFEDGSPFEPLRVETMQEAQRHLVRKGPFASHMRPSYGIELDSWFAFSGLVEGFTQEVRDQKHQAVFLYGWAVRKSNGEVVTWMEPGTEQDNTRRR